MLISCSNKTSKILENATSTADRLILRLKLAGPQRSSALAEAVGIGGEAARQHLTRLATEGLVVAEAMANGVGRPVQLWRLTPAGDARFPDRHAALTAQLIQSMRALLGESAIDQVIATREQAMAQAYAQELAGATDLPDRLGRLAAIRTQEGYMATVEQDGADWLLIEHHCPICVAAAACQGFCRSELALFRSVLGADVQRTEHLLNGDRRCVYRVRSGAGEE